MSKEKLWTKDFIIVSLINFLITLIFFMLMVTIASFAKSEFNASTSMAGLVSSIFIIGTLMGRLVTGRIIGDVGSKKTLLIGLIAFSATTALYFGAFNLPLLLANRFLHGLSVGIASTATGTIIAQLIPPTRRGEGIGYYSMSAIMATAIGPFVGILLTQIFPDFYMIFLINLGLSFICLATFLLVKVPQQVATKSSQTEIASNSGFKLSNFIETKAVPISFVALIIGFSYSGVMSFLSFYSESINLVTAGSYFFLIYAIVILLSRPFTGRLMDTKGANIIVYPSLIIFAIGMTLFSQASSGIILLLAAALIGLGYGNFNSIAQALAIKVTPNHRLGLATSTYFIFYDFGLGVGPYLLGFLVPVFGYRHLFLSMVIVILISIVLYYFLHGRKDKALLQA
ncbi:MFS transporter [Viridibacillus arvi]|uniref:Multidrug MFS transporter n=1 Tax=Viridibacillus arvi TaxID=263475 RepID=A0A0M0L898_9BACL|nr:MFS transporter [Viridibacillus arvi]KOO47259.1 multidrug MFS transporter [Viridibacillus arvi]